MNQSVIIITHEIYQSFDDKFEVRRIFLSTSKAFDKVWHKGLIIFGKVSKLQKAKSISIWQHSKWENVEAGVPQGWPLLFLIYKNDISDNLASKWGRVVAPWDSVSHSETQGSQIESRWCTPLSFGTQPLYEIFVELRVKLEIAQWLKSGERGCLLTSGPKLALGQANNW